MNAGPVIPATTASTKANTSKIKENMRIVLLLSVWHKSGVQYLPWTAGGNRGLKLPAPSGYKNGKAHGNAPVGKLKGKRPGMVPVNGWQLLAPSAPRNSTRSSPRPPCLKNTAVLVSCRITEDG